MHEYTLSTEKNFALPVKQAGAIAAALRPICPGLDGPKPSLEDIADAFRRLGCEVLVTTRTIKSIVYRRPGAEPLGVLAALKAVAPFVPTGARLFYRDSEGAREGWWDQNYIFDAGELKAEGDSSAGDRLC